MGLDDTVEQARTLVYGGRRTAGRIAAHGLVAGLALLGSTFPAFAGSAALSKKASAEIEQGYGLSPEEADNALRAGSDVYNEVGEEASVAAGTLPRAVESLDGLVEKDGPFAGQVLTPAQVEEQRVQLTEWMRRAWVDLPNDSGLTRPWGMTVTYIGESGQMMVNAYTQQYNSIGPGNDDHPERHLWMTVDPEQTTFLGNPDRPLLPKVIVARDLNVSSVVTPNDPHYMEFRLNPLNVDVETASPAEIYDPTDQSIKNVNNLYQLGAGKAEANPGLGRGLQDVVTKASAFSDGRIDKYDTHVMQLFGKIFKGSTPNGPRLPTSLIVYRGEGTASDLAQGIRDYTVEVFPRNPETFGFEDNGGQPYGSMRVNVKVKFDEKGNIVNLPSDRAAEAMQVDGSLPDPSVDMSAYVHRPAMIPTLVVNQETGEVKPIPGDTYKYSSLNGQYGVGVGGAVNDRNVIDWGRTLPPRENGAPHHWRGPMGE